MARRCPSRPKGLPVPARPEGRTPGTRRRHARRDPRQAREEARRPRGRRLVGWGDLDADAWAGPRGRPRSAAAGHDLRDWLRDQGLHGPPPRGHERGRSGRPGRSGGALPPDRCCTSRQGRPITLLDLASHTSGLPRLPKGLLRLSLRQRSNPYAGFTAAHLERAIAETAPRRPPGKKIAYSNYGFGLLGHALARRAGTTYEQLVRERIGEPLGLENTSIAVSPAARGRFADGHDRRGRPVPHWHLPALAGAGALRSTLADLLRILELHLREPDSRLAVAARSTHKERAQRGGLVQCLGWVSLPLRGSSHRMLWHNGGTGGFRSFVGFVPAAGAGVVVLTNCSRSVDAIGFRVLERLVRDPGNV
jgi:D-alanyl-D-alanine-carboxypeptidase/D-alanyl-D-alanine-endopeptidase